MDKTKKIKDKILYRIDLAFRALGDRGYQPSYCKYEPDVGYVPCVYCALFYALVWAREYIRES